jgi:hypothetical protein
MASRDGSYSYATHSPVWRASAVVRQILVSESSSVTVDVIARAVSSSDAR